MDEVFLGNESIGAKGTQVIIDSGTSFLLMPLSKQIFFFDTLALGDFGVFKSHFENDYKC